jgi:hypothetical protein
VAVEVSKNLVRRRSELINESLKEVITLDLAKSAALGTFPIQLERIPEAYDEVPPQIGVPTGLQ